MGIIVGIDHVFVSGAVVGPATTHSWGRPSLRTQRGDWQPHECVVARPTTAPDGKTLSSLSWLSSLGTASIIINIIMILLFSWSLLYHYHSIITIVLLSYSSCYFLSTASWWRHICCVKMLNDVKHYCIFTVSEWCILPNLEYFANSLWSWLYNPQKSHSILFHEIRSLNNLALTPSMGHTCPTNRWLSARLRNLKRQPIPTEIR